MVWLNQYLLFLIASIYTWIVNFAWLKQRLRNDACVRLFCEDARDIHPKHGRGRTASVGRLTIHQNRWGRWIPSLAGEDYSSIGIPIAWILAMPFQSYKQNAHDQLHWVLASESIKRYSNAESWNGRKNILGWKMDWGICEWEASLHRT